jgi:hypothetical protein
MKRSPYDLDADFILRSSWLSAWRLTEILFPSLVLMKARNFDCHSLLQDIKRMEFKF